MDVKKNVDILDVAAVNRYFNFDRQLINVFEFDWVYAIYIIVLLNFIIWFCVNRNYFEKV